LSGRRTKIVATIGPACFDRTTLERMVAAGMDVARLNLSHGTADERRRQIALLREVERSAHRPLAIMMDTAGPEVRIAGLPDAGRDLVAGETVTVGGAGTDLVPSWPGVLAGLEPGDRLLLDDGNLVLRVLEPGPPVRAVVVVGGHLQNHKKLSCPGSRWDLDVLTEADRAQLAVGAELGIDWVAASFVRGADDVFAVRRVLEDMGAPFLPIMAKIENALGIQNLDDIVRAADGIMVARGDLGVELPVEELPGLQKQIILAANLAGKPVVTATQMLESMVDHGRPTRAEVTDVANAIWDGSDAVMLSAETASGRYPVEAVATMAQVAAHADAHEHMHVVARARINWARVGSTVTTVLAQATAESAEELNAQAIITATESGHTAQAVARCRPWVPILAVTPREEVARRLQVVWGVTPCVMAPAKDTDDMMERAVQVALETGVVEPGALVVLTGGVPVGQPGTTNLLRVLTIGEAILRGQGVGPEQAATGEVLVVEDVRAVSPRQMDGKVLVAAATDRDFVPLIERACAVVVEAGGLTSHAAVVGLSMGKPTVVGAHDAMRRLASGQIVTVDGHRGLVFRGSVQV
jgi:pyruvate kinase